MILILCVAACVCVYNSKKKKKKLFSKIFKSLMLYKNIKKDFFLTL